MTVIQYRNLIAAASLNFENTVAKFSYENGSDLFFRRLIKPHTQHTQTHSTHILHIVSEKHLDYSVCYEAQTSKWFFM